MSAVEELPQYVNGFHLKCAIGKMTEDDLQNLNRFYRTLMLSDMTAG